MAFAIHGNTPDGKCFTYRSRITGRVVRYWALRGLVRIVDEATGDYKIVSRRKFLERTYALSAECTRRYTPYSDERKDLQDQVAIMVEVARAAGAQGDPFAPSNVTITEHRRATTVNVPHGALQAHRDLPPKVAVPAGKQAAPQVTPSLILPAGYRT